MNIILEYGVYYMFMPPTQMNDSWYVAHYVIHYHRIKTL